MRGGSSGIWESKNSACVSANSSSKKNMKAILLNHWQAKLTSLILAAVLWYLIKQGVGRTPERPSLSRPVPAETPKPSNPPNPPKKSPSK